MAPTRTLMTADELLRLPDDGQRHELGAGELRTMPLRGAERGALSARLAVLLSQHLHEHQLGRVVAAGTGFLLTRDPDTVLAPDAAFMSREQVGGANPTPGYPLGAPDLAVEIISPGDLYIDVEDKVATWLAHGARVVIVVNPRHRTVTVHRSPTDVRHLTVGDTLDAEDVLPGWTLPVRQLFGAGG